MFPKIFPPIGLVGKLVNFFGYNFRGVELIWGRFGPTFLLGTIGFYGGPTREQVRKPL